MIEVELKAHLCNPDAVRAALGGRAPVEKAVYRDVYYDRDGALQRAGRELRIRTVQTSGGSRHLLTYKDAAVDPSGSKPEHETTVADARVLAYVVEQLGYTPSVELTKDCENYRFVDGGREFLATVVRVPELAGTFLEVETMADPDGVDEALAGVRAVLDQLGVPPTDLTSDLYTDAVRAARARMPR